MFLKCYIKTSSTKRFIVNFKKETVKTTDNGINANTCFNQVVQCGYLTIKPSKILTFLFIALVVLNFQPKHLSLSL